MPLIYLYILLAYLLGSIPVGYWLTRYHTGKNILHTGSGNIGSTNVKRIAGKKVAAITQILDMLKGLLPVGLFLFFYKEDLSSTDASIYGIAFASIIGHDFSIFLGFKGGKGVNTTLGASVLLSPYAVFTAVLVYYIVKWRYRYVSLGSMALSTSLPFVEFLINGASYTFFYLLACMLLIIYCHKKNIQRLIRGEENLA